MLDTAPLPEAVRFRLVGEFRSLADSLLEDVLSACEQVGGSRGGNAFSDDLGKMRDASRRLSESLAQIASGQIPIRNEGEWRAARHDLRTPIAAIIGYGELLAEEFDAADLVEFKDALNRLVETAQVVLQKLEDIAAPATPPPADDDSAVAIGAPPVLSEVIGARAAWERDQGPDVVGRILVVDDSETMRDLMGRRLLRFGCEVETCGDGRRALELARTGHFDLMLLDLMMPGVSGLDVLRELDEHHAGEMPVIVVSAFDETAAAVRCIDAGADDFLSKPVDETLLRARISSSLERKFLRDRERQTMQQLKIEQERSEMLLRNVLPATVVDRLRAGETVIADHFEDATILFCDLVGFTAMSARLPPQETLNVLNAIFSRFDDLAERQGLEKIKTIGDAYMLAGGISAPFEGHAERVIEMATLMPSALESVEGAASLDVRIGIASGPVAAGIIGRQKFFYDVWGDTVNMASRLEESCPVGRIHVSAATFRQGGHKYASATPVDTEIRGKGLLKTFLIAENQQARTTTRLR